MPADKDDPIADTAMFRAFYAEGEAAKAERKPLGVPIGVAVLVTLVAVALVWLFLR